jgi:Flp pilus assembly protein TadG
MKSDLLMDRKKEKGQALVEFALTAILFLFLIFGIIEVGRFVFSVAAIRTAAREGARYGSAAGGLASGVDNFYEDCDGIEAAATRIGNYAGLQNWNVDVAIDSGVPTNIIDECNPQLSNPEIIELGHRVVVTTTGTIVPFVGLLPLPEFTYSSTSRRTIVKDVTIE